jgi:hypothetical protein
MAPDEAHLRASIPAAISGWTAGDRVLRGSMPPGPPGAGDWFRCAAGVFLRIPRLGGRPVRMDAADGPGMAALLDAADPLLSAIEAALGLGLVPDAMGAAGGVVVAVEAVAPDGTVDSRIELALPPETRVEPRPAPAAALLVGHIPVPARIVVDGPRLAPAEAATIRPGDLLLLGPGVPAARLHAGSGPGLPGTLDPARRQFRPDPPARAGHNGE